MDEKLTKQLHEKYPKILRDLHGDPSKTCMSDAHGGIACGPGWYDLLDRAMAFCQFHTDKNYYPQVIAVQIKEKFGTLRFYYELEDNPAHAELMKTVVKPEYGKREPEMLRGAIAFAESMSSIICESCGAPAETRGGNWVYTLCDPCADKTNVKDFDEPEEF